MLFRSLFESRYLSYLFYGCAGSVFLWLFYQGPILSPDSGGYISGSAYRPPLYPLLLKGYNFVFEGNYRFLIFLQLLFGFLSIHKLTSTFRQAFTLTKVTSILVFAILTLPYFYHSGRNILTESISYPIFLIFLSYLIEGTLNNHLKSLITTMFLASILMLTRSQFVFIYPFFLILIGYLFIKERDLRKTILLTLTLLGVIITANLLERTYHYFNSGTFSTVPSTGMILINNFLYLSKTSDVVLFEEKIEQKFFQTVHKEIDEKGYTLEKKPENMTPAYHLELVYDKILYGVVLKHVGKFFGADPFALDKKLFEISLVLAQHNFKDWLKLFVGKILKGLGNYWFTLVSLAAGLMCLPKIFNSNNKLSITYVVLFTLAMLNLILIGIFHYPLTRYTIYTQLPLSCFVITLLEKAFSQERYGGPKK